MSRHPLLTLFHRRELARRTYTARLRQVAPANLVDIWPLSETSGTTAAALKSSALNASYRASVAPGTSWPTAAGQAQFVAPGLFPATGDILFPAAALASLTNWNEGSIAFWMRAALTTWDDGTARRPLLWQIDSSNRIFIQKSSGADTFQASYIGGGTTKSITVSNVSQYCGTGWLHVCLTWSKTGDVMRLYLNGELAGSVTTLSTISGTLAIPIIAGNPYCPNSTYAYAGLWSTPLSASEVQALITPIMRDQLLVFEGDSLTVGGQLSAVPYPKTLIRALSNESAARTVATSGHKISDMITDYPTQVAPLYRPQSFKKSTVVLLGGSNDIQNESVATAYSRLQTYWALCRATGFQVVACTLPAGNPTGSTNPYNDYRNALNTLILSDTSLYTAVARLDQNANIGQDGDQDNTTYFNADKTHFTTAGYTEIATVVAAVLP